MKRFGRALMFGAALVLAGPSSAALVPEPRLQLQEWQDKEARLFGIGWRLATGNAPFCADAAPAVGLLLHDAGSYAEPEAVRAALGLTGPIGVQAVATGSPAAQAGLRANDTLLKVDDDELALLPLDKTQAWSRLTGITAAFNKSLAQDGEVELRWHDASGGEREALLRGVPACPSRFELLSESDRVSADGARVLLGERFAGFIYPDDLLAAAVAHELAHNLLRHRERLDRQGRSQANVRATEREADRMMPWLLANAGYPPDAAVRFMRRWGPRSTGGQLGGLLRARSHDGWDERATLIAAELPLITRALATEGLADWRGRFSVVAP